MRQLRSGATVKAAPSRRKGTGRVPPQTSHVEANSDQSRKQSKKRSHRSNSPAPIRKSARKSAGGTSAQSSGPTTSTGNQPSPPSEYRQPPSMSGLVQPDSPTRSDNMDSEEQESTHKQPGSVLVENVENEGATSDPHLSEPNAGPPSNILNRLGPIEAPSNNSNNNNNHPHSFPEFPDRDDTEFPNLENFKDKMMQWPMGKIRKYLRAHKSETKNRPSPVIQQEAELAYQVYEHTLLMLALVGNVSEKTIRQKL